jgi:hypothetical protein
MTDYGNLFSDILNETPQEPPRWFKDADWIKTSSWLGAIEHHMRIVDYRNFWKREYLVFHTTPTVGYAHYEWVSADELERNAIWVNGAVDAAHASLILQRAFNSWGLEYSVPKRQDCESLQRWIQTGDENYRWSPQFWSGVALVVFAVGYAVVNEHRNQQQ